MRANDPLSIHGLAALTLYFCVKVRDFILRGMDGQFGEFTHLHWEGRDQPHSVTRKVKAANGLSPSGCSRRPGNIDIQTRPNAFFIGDGIHTGSFNKQQCDPP